jgi:hypothetical protein
MTDILERLWKKVDRRGPDECWPWTACVSPKGYGLFGVRVLREDGTRRSTRASRLVYEETNGVLLTDAEKVLHSCDNPPCCNPAHLFVGDELLNAQDRNAKKRHAHGEKHPRAKLTEEDVVVILRDTRSNRELSNAYGVSWRAIDLIRKRQNWPHVRA